MAAVDVILDDAFGPDRRTRTAYRLRAGSEPLPALSLAARADDGGLIGSVQCWPIALLTRGGRAHSLILLGPVAVAAAYRGAGIGSAMIRNAVTRAGDTPLLLIGDEPYYGRFGFTAAHTGGWTLPGPVERHRLLARGAERLPAMGALCSAFAARAAA